MSIRLDIHTDNGRVPLHVGEDDYFEATFQANLLADLSSREASYSNTITVPKTPHNVKLLRDARHTKVLCDLYVNNNLVFPRGYVSVDSETKEQYEITIYSESVQEWKALGDKYIVGENVNRDKYGNYTHGILQNHPNWNLIWSATNTGAGYYNIVTELQADTDNRSALTLVPVQIDHYPSLERFSYASASDYAKFDKKGKQFESIQISGTAARGRVDIDIIENALNTYRQPIVAGDDGRFYVIGEYEEEFAYFPFANPDNPNELLFPLKNYVPAVRHKDLLLDALEEEGYKLTGSLLTDVIYDKLYIYKTDQEIKVNAEYEYEDLNFNSSTQTIRAHDANAKYDEDTVDNPLLAPVWLGGEYQEYSDVLAAANNESAIPNLVDIPFDYEKDGRLPVSPANQPTHFKGILLPKKFRGTLEFQVKVSYTGEGVDFPTTLAVYSNMGRLTYDVNTKTANTYTQSEFDWNALTGDSDSIDKVAELKLRDTGKHDIIHTLKIDINDHLHFDTFFSLIVGYDITITEDDVNSSVGKVVIDGVEYGLRPSGVESLIETMIIKDLRVRITPKDYSTLTEVLPEMDITLNPDSFIPKKTIKELLLEAARITNTNIEIDGSFIHTYSADQSNKISTPANVLDWSNKVIQDTEEIFFNPKGSKDGKVARMNHFRWKNENKINYDIWEVNYPMNEGNNVSPKTWGLTVPINDNKLDYESKIIELPYSASNASSELPYTFDFRSAGTDRIFMLGDRHEVVPVIFGNTITTVKNPYLSPIDWAVIGERNYKGWISSVKDCEYYEVDAILNIEDVINFDFSSPIYVDFYDNYFLVDRIEYSEKMSRVHMMKIAELSDFTTSLTTIDRRIEISKSGLKMGAWRYDYGLVQDTFTITNIGNVSNTVSLSTPTNFTVSPTNFTLNPDQSQVITVGNNTSGAGFISGEIDITHQGGGTIFPVSIARVKPTFFVKVHEVNQSVGYINFRVYIDEPIGSNESLTITVGVKGSEEPEQVVVLANQSYTSFSYYYVGEPSASGTTYRCAVANGINTNGSSAEVTLYSVSNNELRAQLIVGSVTEGVINVADGVSQNVPIKLLVSGIGTSSTVTVELYNAAAVSNARISDQLTITQTGTYDLPINNMRVSDDTFNDITVIQLRCTTGQTITPAPIDNTIFMGLTLQQGQTTIYDYYLNY